MDSLKRKKKILNMAKMIIEKTARTVEILASTSDCTHFKLAVYFVLDIVLNILEN